MSRRLIRHHAFIPAHALRFSVPAIIAAMPTVYVKVQVRSTESSSLLPYFRYFFRLISQPPRHLELKPARIEEMRRMIFSPIRSAGSSIAMALKQVETARSLFSPRRIPKICSADKQASCRPLRLRHVASACHIYDAPAGTLFHAVLSCRAARRSAAKAMPLPFPTPRRSRFYLLNIRPARKARRATALISVVVFRREVRRMSSLQNENRLMLRAPSSRAEDNSKPTNRAGTQATYAGKLYAVGGAPPGIACRQRYQSSNAQKVLAAKKQCTALRHERAWHDRSSLRATRETPRQTWFADQQQHSFIPTRVTTGGRGEAIVTAQVPRVQRRCAVNVKVQANVKIRR